MGGFFMVLLLYSAIYFVLILIHLQSCVEFIDLFFEQKAKVLNNLTFYTILGTLKVTSFYSENTCS